MSREPRARERESHAMPRMTGREGGEVDRCGSGVEGGGGSASLGIDSAAPGRSARVALRIEALPLN